MAEACIAEACRWEGGWQVGYHTVLVDRRQLVEEEFIQLPLEADAAAQASGSGEAYGSVVCVVRQFGSRKCTPIACGCVELANTCRCLWVGT